MSRLDAYALRSEFVGELERKLANDEAIVAFTDMSASIAKPGQISTSITRTVVLTTRAIHFVEWRWKNGKPLSEIKSHVSIPLHEISAFGTQVKVGGRFTWGTYSMYFRWSGGSERWSSHFDNAPAVIAACEAAVQGKVAAEQAGLTADAVTQLGALVGDGLLTQEEFEQAKAGFIGRPSSDGERAIALLRQLYGLKVAGVLSESEFNMKKWDVLSKR